MTTTTTEKRMAAKTMTEDQMVGLVRNALLVAGQEMGANGDHWPVINSTIHSIMRDAEAVKVERDVFAEVRKNYQVMLKEMEDLYAESSADAKPHVRAAIKAFQDIYDASFSPVDKSKVDMKLQDFPLHVQRAETIVKTLEDSDG